MIHLLYMLIVLHIVVPILKLKMRQDTLPLHKKGGIKEATLGFGR
jgi:hypothetical protein